MDRKKKTFDAVKMVREIRDRHYEQTKGMTGEQQIAFYRDKARKLHEQLKGERKKTATQNQ